MITREDIERLHAAAEKTLHRLTMETDGLQGRIRDIKQKMDRLKETKDVLYRLLWAFADINPDDLES